MALKNLRFPPLLAFVIFILVAGIFASTLPRNPSLMQTPNEYTTVHIGSADVRAEVASTSEAREQGLSGHAPLGEDEGMLFVFDWDDSWGFWMKDMLFPIDIIWIDQAGSVVTIAKSATPSSYPQVFYPAGPARYVLEVPAGFSDLYDIAEGTKVVLQ